MNELFSYVSFLHLRVFSLLFPLFPPILFTHQPIHPLPSGGFLPAHRRVRPEHPGSPAEDPVRPEAEGPGPDDVRGDAEGGDTGQGQGAAGQSLPIVPFL